jgi:hypothetical protein
MDDLADRHALGALVRQVLDGLPRQQRAVLALRYCEDLPEAAVAQLLGCSAGSVKTHPPLRKPGSAWTELPRPAAGSVPAGHVQIGYARASTARQSLGTQADSLRASGVTRVFSEKISTRAVTRPELHKAVVLAWRSARPEPRSRSSSSRRSPSSCAPPISARSS